MNGGGEAGPPPALRPETQDRLRAAFEAAWRAGVRPRIEDYLVGVPEAARPALWQELLNAEIAWRRAAGERPTPEEYRVRWPTQTGVVDDAFTMTPPVAVGAFA